MTPPTKFTVLTIILLLQFGCRYQAPEYEQNIQPLINSESQALNYSNFIGDWYHDDYDVNNEAKSTLSIQIDDINDSTISGEYCYVSSYGNKIDCGNSFEGKAIKDDQYQIVFYSSFDNLKGQATLTLDTNSIIWTLNRFPNNLGVAAPHQAVLTKQILP